MHKGTRHHTEARRHGCVRRLAPFIAAAVAAVATPVVSGIAATGKDQPSRVYAAKANHKLPELRVTAAAAKLNEDGTLTGTATVENAGTARARATTAGVDWKDSATHGEVLLAKFAVPLLKPGQKHKVTWHLKLASKDTAGTYAVQVCADVLSQVHEASKKHLCHSAGSVVFNPKGGVKGFKEEEPPKEAPKETPKEEAPKEAPKETPKETPTGPPDTAIASGPTGAVDSTAATFTFTSNQSPATFQCALDASAWTACSSPQTYNARGQPGERSRRDSLRRPLRGRWSLPTRRGHARHERAPRTDRRALGRAVPCHRPRVDRAERGARDVGGRPRAAALRLVLLRHLRHRRTPATACRRRCGPASLPAGRRPAEQEARPRRRGALARPDAPRELAHRGRRDPRREARDRWNGLRDLRNETTHISIRHLTTPHEALRVLELLAGEIDTLFAA